VSRPAGTTTHSNSSRERLRTESKQAAPLRDVHPQLAELRVEFDFDDGTARPPSVQSYFHFPAARGFFRYPCPCHSCSGDFDLSGYVAELAGSVEHAQLMRQVILDCTGQRPLELRIHEACPVRASIRISATLHAIDQSMTPPDFR
jgi:hypothetical protein